jgi:uncharacterized protein
MIYRMFGTRCLVRIDRGEEIVSCLAACCRRAGIRLGGITAIGAVDRAVVGLREAATKRYVTRELTGDMEITALAGNVATLEGEIALHLHATLSDGEFRAWGGHLQSARVSGTCEVVIEVIDGEWGRVPDEETGLNILSG